AGDDHDAALKLVTAAEAAATKAKSLALVGRAKKAAEEVAAVQKEFGRVQPFLAKLAKEPDDPEASTAAGKYSCLAKGNWKKGLPLLLKGKDEGLQALAKKDMASPKAAKKQVELGDAWWDLAGKEKAPAKERLQERAGFWYDQALPDLTGLNRVRV